MQVYIVLFLCARATTIQGENCVYIRMCIIALHQRALHCIGDRVRARPREIRQKYSHHYSIKYPNTYRHIAYSRIYALEK